EVLAKQVELLSAAVPQLKRVSVLMNRSNPANGFFFDAMSLRAKTLSRRFDVLSFIQRLALAHRSQLRRQDSQGREARQYPGGAANQVRATDQPQDREGARHHRPAIAT